MILRKKKILCAKEIIQSKNPYCKIILHPYNIITNNALEIIQYYDIIIDACDNFKTRYIIDQYCYQLHKVHIYGAIQEFESQISVFNYKNSIIYSDIYPNNMNLINHNCNYYGVIGIITGHIGILQAAETIKIILGIGNIIYNQLLVFNLLNIKVKNTLIYISKIKKIKKIQYMQKNFIQQNIFIKQPNIFYKNSIILDIRTTNDFKIKHSLCSININLKKFGLKKTIYFLQKKQNKKIMIYCNTTYRSLIISNILDQYKIKYSIIKFN